MSKSEIIYQLVLSCINNAGHFTQFSAKCIKNPEKFFASKKLLEEYNSLDDEEKSIFSSKQKFFDKLVEYGFKTRDNVRSKSTNGKCIICGDPTEFISFDCGYKVCCSSECSNLLRKQRSIERWGCVHPTKNPEVKQRIRNSNINKVQEEKDSIAHRKKMTNLEKYGTINWSMKHLKHIDELYLDIMDANSINIDFIVSKFCDPVEKIYFQNKVKEYFNIKSNPILDKIQKMIKPLGFSVHRENNILESKFLTEKEIEIQRNIIRQYKIPGTRYLVDGFDQEANTVYEFLGDFWHGHPKFPRDRINEINHCTMEYLYSRTFQRLDHLKTLGYNVKYIWESDFKEKGIEGLQSY